MRLGRGIISELVAMFVYLFNSRHDVNKSRFLLKKKRTINLLVSRLETNQYMGITGDVYINRKNGD